MVAGDSIPGRGRLLGFHKFNHEISSVRVCIFGTIVRVLELDKG
jgi:hypothetical protein